MSTTSVPLLPLLRFREGRGPRRASAGEPGGGRRRVETWPLLRPTATSGSVGWMDWAKRSEGRGKVQVVSNIGGRCEEEASFGCGRLGGWVRCLPDWEGMEGFARMRCNFMLGFDAAFFNIISSSCANPTELHRIERSFADERTSFYIDSSESPTSLHTRCHSIKQAQWFSNEQNRNKSPLAVPSLLPFRLHPITLT